MASGIVTTARGMSLNLDELIQQAQRPANTVDANSTRASRNFRVTEDNQPKLRGFVPTAGEAAVSGDQPEEAAPSKASSKKPVKRGPTKTMAEHTQVTVRKNARIKQAEAAIKEDETPVEEDETLGDILSELDAPKAKKK